MIVLSIALIVAASPALMVLQDTGQRLDGLPVFRHHPDRTRYEQVLTRGFSGRLIRLYALEQRVSHPDREVQPAILCLTQNEGGFPRAGFVLDAVTRRSDYVDLHERSALTGSYGAIDQIFPHELMHIILRDLAGERGTGRASQVHAIGVATDRLTAFDEGLAEHAQVMAIDDPDAAIETHLLAGRTSVDAWADRAMDAYRRALTARWCIAPRAVLTFPFWFSNAEQFLRSQAVKQNLFARDPSVRAVRGVNAFRGGYAIYLLDNMLPGTVRGPRKPLARLLATEGVISAFFVRVVTNRAIQDGPAPAAVYDGFHVNRTALEPLDNAYLKLFRAFADGTHDIVTFARAYDMLFPADRLALLDVLRDVFGTSELAGVAEIWLVNPDTPNGTSLFDQFRGRPRPHAFDLNAASMGDLVGVTGIDVDRARTIVSNAPYRSIGDLDRVHGLDPTVRARLQRMAAAETPERGRDAEGSLTFSSILLPYVRYAAIVLLAAATVAAIAYRLARRVPWWRATLNGVGAALVGLICGWIVDGGSGFVGWMAPMGLLGAPAALIAAWRTRSWSKAGRVLGAWALAAGVPVLVLRPMG